MKNIIVTIGPSIFENKAFVDHQDHYIYRINGAHNDENSVKKVSEFLRNKISKPKIMIDLPGNKIRTSKIIKPISVQIGESFFLSKENFNFSKAVDLFQRVKCLCR